MEGLDDIDGDNERKRQLKHLEHVDHHLTRTGDPVVLAELERVADRHRRLSTEPTIADSSGLLEELTFSWENKKEVPTREEAEHAIDLALEALAQEQKKPVGGIQGWTRRGLSWIGISNQAQFKTVAELLAHLILAASTGGLSAPTLIYFLKDKAVEKGIAQIGDYVFADNVEKIVMDETEPVEEPQRDARSSSRDLLDGFLNDDGY